MKAREFVVSQFKYDLKCIRISNAFPTGYEKDVNWDYFVVREVSSEYDKAVAGLLEALDYYRFRKNMAGPQLARQALKNYNAVVATIEKMKGES